MKKTFGLLLLLLAINGCDDGDMVFESFNFDNVSTADCGSSSNINSVFKINGNEALLLKIDGAQTLLNAEGIPYDASLFAFRNQITGENPRIYKINDKTRVIHRVFNGAVEKTYFCQEIPPASPSVASESSTLVNGNGTIEIKTIILEKAYSSISAIQYRHSVTLKNITFSSGGGSTTYETMNFGSYDKASNLSFAFNGPVINCSGKLFKVTDKNPGSTESNSKRENINEVIEFQFSDAELAALPDGNSDTFKIDDAHPLTYRVFSNDVTTGFLCTGDLAGITAYPETYATFKADNGQDATGTTEATGTYTIRKASITPTASNPATGYRYTFTFNRMVFKDQNSTTTFNQNAYQFEYSILNP